jgi:hypothetical protein
MAAGFPDPGPETTVHFSPWKVLQSYWRPCESALHLVNVVATHLQVDPTGQFASAAAGPVHEINAPPMTTPATSKPDMRFMGRPLLQPWAHYHRHRWLSLAFRIRLAPRS